MEPGKSNGALVGLILIIIILVAGGIFVWRSNKSSAPATPGTVTTKDSASLNALDSDLKKADTSTGVSTKSIN